MSRLRRHSTAFDSYVRARLATAARRSLTGYRIDVLQRVDVETLDGTARATMSISLVFAQLRIVARSLRYGSEATSAGAKPSARRLVCPSLLSACETGSFQSSDVAPPSDSSDRPAFRPHARSNEPLRIRTTTRNWPGSQPAAELEARERTQPPGFLVDCSPSACAHAFTRRHVGVMTMKTA